MTSLNPILTIGLQIMEPLQIHLGMNDEQARDTRRRAAAAGRHSRSGAAGLSNIRINFPAACASA